MRITDETGIPETRYFPVIAIDDSGQQKVALFLSVHPLRKALSGGGHASHLPSARQNGDGGDRLSLLRQADGTLLQFTHKCGHVSVPLLSVRRTRK